MKTVRRWHLRRKAIRLADDLAELIGRAEAVAEALAGLAGNLALAGLAGNLGPAGLAGNLGRSGPTPIEAAAAPAAPAGPGDQPGAP
jgi:hypothetical protein